VVIPFPIEAEAYAQDAPGSRLSESVARARLEHEALKDELRSIYEQARRLRSAEESGASGRELDRLHDSLKLFIRDLHEHVRWEDAELLPRAASRLGAEPDLFELMEREYGCAERDFLTCIDVLESSPQPLRAEDAKRLSSCVIQAYAVMNGRLREEEEIIRELEAEVPGACK